MKSNAKTILSTMALAFAGCAPANPYISPKTGAVMPIGVSCEEINAPRNTGGLNNVRLTLNPNTVSAESIDDWTKIEGSNKACTAMSAQPMDVVCTYKGKQVFSAQTQAFTMSALRKVESVNAIEIPATVTTPSMTVAQVVEPGTVCKVKPASQPWPQ
jgi:hypothetical protein